MWSLGNAFLTLSFENDQLQQVHKVRSNLFSTYLIDLSQSNSSDFSEGMKVDEALEIVNFIPTSERITWQVDDGHVQFLRWETINGETLGINAIDGIVTFIFWQ